MVIAATDGEMGGIDVIFHNEAAAATLQYGVRIRNNDQSNIAPVAAALLIPANAGNTTGFSYGVDMNGATIPCPVRMPNGACIYVGAQTTRDTVRAEVGTGGAIGSIYLSSAGKIYLKVANAGATTDWQRVTTTAAD